jgi:hypothetical protein
VIKSRRKRRNIWGRREIYSGFLIGPLKEREHFADTVYTSGGR